MRKNLTNFLKKYSVEQIEYGAEFSGNLDFLKHSFSTIDAGTESLDKYLENEGKNASDTRKKLETIKSFLSDIHKDDITLAHIALDKLCTEIRYHFNNENNV